MRNLTLKKKNSLYLLCGILLCFGVFAFFFSEELWAADSGKIAAYIDKTYEYEKGSDSKVLTENEAKNALTADVDLLVMAAGRDVNRSMMTDDEFRTYLGYVNLKLRNGNGNYRGEDFLRCALAVGAAGGDPSAVGKDAQGNRVDLLYKGLYSRSLRSLEQEGAKTVAYGLLAVDANGISDNMMRANGSKVSRSQLKVSLIAAAKKLSVRSVPDVGTSALIVAALAHDYVNGDSATVSAVDDLLYRIARLQAADGEIKDSLPATAETLTALCALGIDPEDNAYFSENLYQAMMRFYCANGGFATAINGSATAGATAEARCALVAYYCYTQSGLFYDFSGVKSHDVKTIASSTSTSKPNTSSSQTTSKSNTSSNRSSSSSSSLGTKSTAKSSSGSTGTSSGSSTSSSSVTNNASSGNTVAKSVFEGIKGTEESYIYEGTWGEGEPYTLSFKGTDVTNPMDFNAGITSVAPHQMEIDAAADDVEYIVFLHGGAFPGKAAATVSVSLSDGTYQCYHYDETSGKFVQISVVTVANGMVSFTLDVGGEYFLSSSEVNTEGHHFDTGDTIDGIAPASVFEDMAGKDVDLTFEGTLESGIRYEIIFNGEDITEPLDFDTRISEHSLATETIRKLAKDPFILSFYHQGALPGAATVKIYTTLTGSQTYGFYYYNPDEEQGEFVTEVTREEDFLSFTLEHCSDYFIAPYDGVQMLAASAPNRRLISGSLVLELLLLLAAAGAILYRRRGKKGPKPKLHNRLHRKNRASSPRFRKGPSEKTEKNVAEGLDAARDDKEIPGSPTAEIAEMVTDNRVNDGMSFQAADGRKETE